MRGGPGHLRAEQRLGTSRPEHRARTDPRGRSRGQRDHDRGRDREQREPRVVPLAKAARRHQSRPGGVTEQGPGRHPGHCANRGHECATSHYPRPQRVGVRTEQAQHGDLAQAPRGDGVDADRTTTARLPGVDGEQVTGEGEGAGVEAAHAGDQSDGADLAHRTEHEIAASPSLGGHAAPSSKSMSSSAICWGAIAGWLPASRPSASTNTLSAYDAATGSWLTMTMVWPYSRAAVRSSPRTSRELRVSRFPVGQAEHADQVIDPCPRLGREPAAGQLEGQQHVLRDVEGRHQILRVLHLVRLRQRRTATGRPAHTPLADRDQRGNAAVKGEAAQAVNVRSSGMTARRAIAPGCSGPAWRTSI